ncbi:MAG: hypothetical protein GY898_02885 [Proteobacteria bacterium]|nr:hypothetical protein [Pseudomonadota bacterium]
MQFEALIYQSEGGRAVLTLNRPQRRNALSPQWVPLELGLIDQTRA